MSEDKDLTPQEGPASSPDRAVAPASETYTGADAPAAPGADISDAIQSLGTTYTAKQIKRARELLTRLYAARRTVRFYPADHPATIDGMKTLKEIVDKYHDEGVDVALAFFEGELLLGDQLLTEESIFFDQLIRELTGIGAGSIVIRRGVDVPQLTRAVQLLAADSFEVERSGGMQRMIAEANLPLIEIGEVKVYERAEDEDDEDAAKESYNDAIELMREIDTLIRRNEAVNSTKVKGVVRSLVDNVLSNRQAMLALTGLKSHDEYTFYHSANVALLALALGSKITHDYRFLSSLGTGALLHDIGKMNVDLEILNKPGALSADEWALVRQHPVRGAEQAVTVQGLDRSSVVIILEHHMRYDGSGYPHNPIPRRQHLASRIVAIADAYDAMTSRRSYSAARVQDEAMEILVQSAGSALDPVLTRMFVSMLGVYPPRSVVRMSDGRTGIVVRPCEGEPLKPIVRVIAEDDGSLIEPVDIDLCVDTELTIVRSIDGGALNIDVEE